jgi:hypothetical protein
MSICDTPSLILVYLHRFPHRFGGTPRLISGSDRADVDNMKIYVAECLSRACRILYTKSMTIFLDAQITPAQIKVSSTRGSIARLLITEAGENASCV